MTSSRLKLYVSLGVVVSHILTFFGILLLRAFVIPNLDIFGVMQAMVPLFGVFLVVIVKDTIRGREDLSIGNVQTEQMVLLTFIILGSYVLAVASTLLMVARQVIEPADLSKWLGIVESAFGVALGLIIDDLFGGKAQPESSRKLGQ
jgi:hypothetical protein